MAQVLLLLPGKTVGKVNKLEINGTGENMTVGTVIFQRTVSTNNGALLSTTIAAFAVGETHGLLFFTGGGDAGHWGGNLFDCGDNCPPMLDEALQSVPATNGLSLHRPTYSTRPLD